MRNHQPGRAAARRKIGVIITGVVALSIGGVIWQGYFRSQRPNVLLITLDTTRADRIGCYGYDQALTPNLDALAAEGVLFSRAYTPAPLTLPPAC